MGEAVVKSTVLWLGNLLATEINYLGEVTGKVETLRSELSGLAAFLLEATRTRRQDAGVQNALTEGRNLAYDCQDVIETYMLQVAHHGYEQYEGCQLGSALRWVCLLRKAKLVHGIRSQIDDLNKRISILKSNLVSYGVTAQINQVDHQLTRELLPRRVYPHKKEEQVVVGLEKDLDALVERLLNANDQAVITICGMGGVGKSTLAKELYNHPKLIEEDGFKAFGWASASRQFQSNRVLRTLMYLLVPETDRVRRRKIKEDIRADQAHKALYELMEQVKCLVVVDDIWTSDAWSLLKDAFPLMNGTGSRVVLTTRNKDLLSSSLDSHQVHLHLMEGLNDTNSWQLFENITFSGTTCSDSTKETLGREMLRHCRGVPLAIVVLGKILKRKERVEDWKQTHNDISTQILKGGSTPNSAYKEVHDVLQVSYDELPLHLKHCFLYLACFPEDLDIKALSLYELWAGDGVILKEDPNDELEEEMAERYMNELVSRNMVQAAKRWSDGRVSTCKVHDLMRDVCIDIAKREGFLQTVNCHRRMKLRNINRSADNDLLVNCLPERDKRLRRLAVHVSNQEEQNSTLANSAAALSSSNVSRAPNLRSLFLFSFDEKSDEFDCKRLMESICKDCNLLRVLKCRLVYMTGKLPSKLGDLIHLRYLSLRNTRITEVPSSIKRLQWLQTLDLTVDDDVEELTIPNVLWKMKQLRHLLLPGYKSLIRLKNEEENRNASADVQRYTIAGGGMLRLDGLSNLHSLLYIDLDRVDLDRDLSNLQSLKWLIGSCETNKEALHCFLQCSRIYRFWFRVHAQIINESPLIFSTCEALDLLRIYAEPRANFQLRQPLKLPKGLVYLFIYYAQLADDPLPVLEQLPNLQRLYLGTCYGGEKMVCSAGGFPKLTHLNFYGLSSFSQWEVEQEALQKLEYLSIHDCPLRNIPDALPSSVHVKIWN